MGRPVGRPASSEKRWQDAARLRVQLVLEHMYFGKQSVMARALQVSHTLVSLVVRSVQPPTRNLMERLGTIEGVNPEWAVSGNGEPFGMLQRRCSTCQFYVRDQGVNDESGDSVDDGDGGQCHRFPPIYSAVPDTTHPQLHVLSWILPVVTEDHWCGEWQPKPRKLKD